MDTKQAILQIADALSQSPSKLRRAKMWLVIRLLDGSELATVMLAEGTERGYSEATLRRACKGLISHRRSAAFGEGWIWELHEKLDTAGVNEYREEVVNRLLKLVR